MWRMPEFVPLAASAGLRLSLEDGHGDASPRERQGGRAADDPGADYRDLGRPSTPALTRTAESGMRRGIHRLDHHTISVMRLPIPLGAGGTTWRM